MRNSKKIVIIVIGICVLFVVAIAALFFITTNQHEVTDNANIVNMNNVNEHSQTATGTASNAIGNNNDNNNSNSNSCNNNNIQTIENNVGISTQNINENSTTQPANNDSVDNVKTTLTSLFTNNASSISKISIADLPQKYQSNDNFIYSANGDFSKILKYSKIKDVSNMQITLLSNVKTDSLYSFTCNAYEYDIRSQDSSNIVDHRNIRIEGKVRYNQQTQTMIYLNFQTTPIA